jgi:thioredoxin-related protein
MKLASLLLLLQPFGAVAQDFGSFFEASLSWQQIKAKARADDKYIFVECHTTWCSYCKEMNLEVFSDSSVAKILGENFISVKVQCDTSNEDPKRIRDWYVDAHDIESQYEVGTFPTFLFLAPDGSIVHKGVGFKSAQDFIQLLQDAKDPPKQYYTLLKNYQNGQRDYALFPYLTSTARGLNDTSVSSMIASDYILNYLNKLSDSAFCQKDNFQFIFNYRAIISSKDKVFNWFSKRPRIVDSVMQDNNYSKRMENYIILKEEITPVVSFAKEHKISPDWNRMSRTISHKFGKEFVETNVLNAKVKWYKDKQDWKRYSRFFVQKCENDTIENWSKYYIGKGILNNVAWDVFQHSQNKMELMKALDWVNIAMKMNLKQDGNIVVYDKDVIDTKANLLYKLGKKNAALILENRVRTLAPEDTLVQQNLHKMEQGKPTW